jgi:hypothetical protein
MDHTLTADERATHTYKSVEGPMFSEAAVERILAARLAAADARDANLRALARNPSGTREWHNQGRSGTTPVVDVSDLLAVLDQPTNTGDSDG